MSLVFSSPTDGNGIVEKAKSIVGIDRTDTTTWPLAEITRDVNLGVDMATFLIMNAQGKWKFDDTNFTDFPIVTTDLVAGQRDYNLVEDGDGNPIVDILRVFIKTAQTNGVYLEIYPVDPTSDSGTQSFTNGLEQQGIPYRYQKLGTSIILDGVPPAAVTDGLKVYIGRTGSYFTVDDTTKMPGFSPLLHGYLPAFAAYEYATAKGLSVAGGVLRNGGTTGLLRTKGEWETKFPIFYGNRARDERPVFRGRRLRYK